MVSIWNSFKSLAVWQIAVLAVVIFGAAGATYGGYVRGTSPDLVDLEENQQLIPVRYGDLINEITTNGSLVFPNRETLSFGSPGTVMEILVEEGSPVTAGQVLAKLDATSVASLAQQVAQRELDLNDSTEILEETRAIDPLELAQKQEAVAIARFQLKEAIDALEDAREPYTAQEIETQRQLVADTRLDLQSAERALAGLARDHAVQLAQAREAKTNADLTFDVSRQELSDFARDYTQQVALARQVKASAELALDAARESLDDLPRIHTDDLAQARQDQADAQVALDLAQRGLAAYSPDYNLELAEAGEEAALAATALDQAEENLADFHRDYDAQLAQARLDEPAAQSELKETREAHEAYEKANARILANNRAQRAEIEADIAGLDVSLDSAIRAFDQGLLGLDLHIRRLREAREFMLEDLTASVDALVVVDQLT
ncbi:MAG: biotin/lipoyl-binding protein, partial [Chloroflexi bacterium]|nr:biotin/lipoyl-binding protein [Chloroflexota bacterium]